MWICRCGAQNKLASRSCSVCGAWMPQSERDRIYKEQLTHTKVKRLEKIIGPVLNLLKTVLVFLGVTEDRAVEIVGKYFWIPLAVITFIIVIFGLKGLFEMINYFFYL